MFFAWPFLRAGVFTTGFIVNPVVNFLKSRCKKWPFENAETSVAAEPFELAGNAFFRAGPLKIIKISSKKISENAETSVAAEPNASSKFA